MIWIAFFCILAKCGEACCTNQAQMQAGVLCCAVSISCVFWSPMSLCSPSGSVALVLLGHSAWLWEQLDPIHHHAELHRAERLWNGSWKGFPSPSLCSVCKHNTHLHTPLFLSNPSLIFFLVFFLPHPSTFVSDERYWHRTLVGSISLETPFTYHLCCIESLGWQQPAAALAVFSCALRLLT